MRRLIILAIGLLLTISLYSHPWKPNHYVIIDTDGGIDDIRTITMLLASPDVRVLAITISPGSLGVSNAYIKVKSLLNSFYHEGIPVGINRGSSFKSPEFSVALNTLWGKETGLNEKDSPDCLSLIAGILNAEKTKISFISLGSLSTASLAINELPAFTDQVKEIIWSGSVPDFKVGFNYKADSRASEKVIKSKIPLFIVNGLEEPFYNDSFLKKLSEINTIYAACITRFFSTETAKNHKYSYSGTDEMVALYLHFPRLFRGIPDNGINIKLPFYSDSLRLGALKILSGETVARNQVIKEFPVDPSFYFSDVEPSVSSIVKKYGKDEFISGIIANELHRHLGAYAIIGVKMGIRAREYFDTGVDEFSAVSFAGSMPPLSCMNDGIQVSTGATPGHGLLTVRNDTVSIPVVDFTYLNRKIRLTLKPEIAQKISNELKEINYVYGLDSNIYWELVRKNSIKYWLNLDRHEIFSIEEVIKNQ
jgi:pyrimidine-specific ribonucleoside hydrolase